MDHICSLLSFFLVLQVPTHGVRPCPSTNGIHVFGESCNLMCHCKNGNEACDVTSGSCSSGCAQGWYGPACQYRDLAANASFPSNVKSGNLDEDLKGCYVASKIKGKPVWKVQLNSLETISEIHIVTKRDKLHYFSNFKVLVVDTSLSTTKKQECYTKKNEAPKSEQFTVHCDKHLVGNQIKIKLTEPHAELVLCDVKINGGRNLAFKRNASQSKTHSHCNSTTCGAERAVDGRFDKNWLLCSYISSSRKPSWEVDLGSQVMIRLINLSSLNGEDTSSYVVRISNNTGTVSMETRMNDALDSIGRFINVTRKTNKQLAICELHVYGDCLEDKCGFDCQKSCHCKDATIWDKMSGNCSSGCKDKWKGSQCNILCEHGPNCEKNCSENCNGGHLNCYRSNGHCSNGCKPGWVGSHCVTECPARKFGEECKEDCPSNCKNNDCNHVNGYCSHGCIPGYHGNTCEKQCPARKFGEECKEDCPSNCKNDDCNHVNGHCSHGCKPGYHGNDCEQQCPARKFGEECKEDCPSNCKNDDCNHVNGHCSHGCKPGYHGNDCEQQCPARKFGEECKEDCPSNCKNDDCNHVNGHCSHGCKPGYHGNNCEKQCPARKFGEECKEDCPSNCKNNDCNHVNGYCSHGCIPGYHGNTCEKQCPARKFGEECKEDCPSNCKNDDCNHVNGHCSHGCKPGYHGNDCEQQCMPGKFGHNCMEDCPSNCKNHECGYKDGDCKNECKQGFRGNKCKENCMTGTFGENCATQCSGNCVGGNTMCRNTDGHCLNGCQPGWNGTNCFSECDIGFYGENCASVCGNCQLGTSCNHVTGICDIGCKAGYIGDNCLQALQTSNISDAVTGSIVALVLVIVAAIIVIFWHKRRNQNTRKDEQKENMELAHASVPAINRNKRQSSAEKVPTNSDARRSVVSEANIYNNMSILDPVRDAVPLSNLLSYVKQNLDNPEHFTKEFQEIPYGMKKSSSVAKKSYNRGKNRYKDMHAYDETRVRLRTLPHEVGSDYINASFIKGHHKENAYIAAQGPIDASIDDFWRMIWEKEIYTIAMVTKLDEDGKVKCQKYWPSVETSERYGKTIVYTASEIIFFDFTIRNLNVSLEGEPQRNIRQFHFTSWPDKSVPKTTSSLLQFWRKVRKNDENKDHTWLVHCSAGVGRTGTFIALDILYDQGKEKGSIDVYKCVKDLRDQRVNMVQTKDQYVFLHGLMIGALLLYSESVPLDKIHKVVRDLKTVDEATNQIKLMLQYEALKEDMTLLRTEKEAKEMYSTALLKENRSKNRFSTVLPTNEFRPFLVTNIPGCTQYINAVLIPSYSHKQGYFVTQKPLENTAIDFCRLIYEQNVKVIVKFPDNEKDHVRPDMKVGPFTLRKVSKEDKIFYTKTVFNMTHGSKESTIIQLEFNNWNTDQITPAEPTNMLHFIQEVELLYKVADESPVIVQCLDGSEKSGLLVTLMNIFERVKMDNEVCIPQVIKELRYIRHQFIPNFEQFKFCYDAVLCYVDSNQMYANM